MQKKLIRKVLEETICSNILLLFLHAQHNHYKKADSNTNGCNHKISIALINNQVFIAIISKIIFLQP